MSVAIITANFGGFDTIRAQPEQDIDVDWFAVTDNEVALPQPWNLKVKSNYRHHPCLAAKAFKTEPWNYLGFDYDHIIWIDSNMEITSPSFAREAIECINDSGVAVFKHPRRDCIYEEADASLGVESQGGKYDEQPLRPQVENYRRTGHPEHGGLYACGVVAWEQSFQTRKFGALWMHECRVWSWQDQLSFPVVCRWLRLEPGVFPHSQVNNPWLKIHPHL